jgi:predicted secreted protein
MVGGNERWRFRGMFSGDKQINVAYKGWDIKLRIFKIIIVTDFKR